MDNFQTETDQQYHLESETKKSFLRLGLIQAANFLLEDYEFLSN
jgi:hypothetical protein